MKSNHFAAAIVSAFAVASQAAAHTSLVSSSIEAGAALETAPSSLELIFGAEVGLADIKLKTAAGDAVKLDYNKPKSMQKSFSVPLPSLNSGSYVIYWRTISNHGHAMRGDIPFTLK